MMILVCQGAWGLVDRTGRGHTGGVGRLVLGHTARSNVLGWSRQVIMRTTPVGASAG